MTNLTKIRSVGNNFNTEGRTDCHGKSSIQRDEESFYQHIGHKFEEETSKMLHLEHGFVWC
jgi:hypothetical protein